MFIISILKKSNYIRFSIMLYNLYQLWNIYRLILYLHGAYVACSFICWSLSTSYIYLAYVTTFFYVQPVKQLKDKNRLDELN